MTNIVVTDHVACIRFGFFWLSAMTIKRRMQTKFRLPILNWTPLRPQQVKGTIFSEIDDEKLYSVRLCLWQHILMVSYCHVSVYCTKML